MLDDPNRKALARVAKHLGESPRKLRRLLQLGDTEIWDDGASIHRRFASGRSG